MAIKLSQAAELDLFQIALDGFDLFGPDQAAKYEAGLNKTLDFLSRNPRAAAEHTEFVPPVRMHPYQVHVILYRIEENDLLIVRICHSREDWTRLV